MKKLMIAVAAVAMAAVASASNVNWSCTNIYQVDSSTKGSGYIGYLFDAATVSDTAAVEKAIKGGTFTTTYASQAAISGTSNASGAIAKFPAVQGKDAGTYNYYVVLFNAGSEANADHYILTATKSVTVPATGAGTLAFANITGTGTGTEWKAIPEPTSGLLLLLGVAGLALRRKQK